MWEDFFNNPGKGGLAACAGSDARHILSDAMAAPPANAASLT